MPNGASACPGPPPAARPRPLRPTPSTRSINGNKSERGKLIGILGVCGILGTADHPGYDRAFIPYRDRQLPARRFTDQDYPACWWTAADGVNNTALRAFLPQLT